MTVGDIYQDIGQRISDSIEEEWQKATLLIDRLENYISVEGSYITEGIEKRLDEVHGYLFSINIHELHLITTAQAQNKWNKLKIVMLSSGKFEMDFIWDQEYQDEINTAK